MEQSDPQADLVSVIMPAYNRADTIAAAIDSVLAQDHEPLELVVVDDGSTDGTAEVVARYGDRVRCLRLGERAGPSAARNAGIRAARGAFIAFLDSDDLWLPGKLARQMRLFREDPELGLACGRWLHFGGDRPEREGWVGEGRGPADLLRRNFVGTLTVVVRRQCLDEVGLFDTDLEVSEDYELWLRIASRFRIALLDEVVARYRRHEGNLSRDKGRIVRGEIEAVDRAAELFRERGIALPEGLVRQRRGELVAKLGRAHLRSGRYREARRCFGRALRLDSLRGRVWLRWLRSLWLELLRDETRSADA